MGHSTPLKIEQDSLNEPRSRKSTKGRDCIDWRFKEIWQLNATLNPEFNAGIELVISGQTGKIQIKSTV